MVKPIQFIDPPANKCEYGIHHEKKNTQLIALLVLGPIGTLFDLIWTAPRFLQVHKAESCELLVQPSLPGFYIYFDSFLRNKWYQMCAFGY